VVPLRQTATHPDRVGGLVGVTERALGYVRVSTAREEMIAPELQAAAIREHCTRNGYRLVDIRSDLDQTGRNFARAEVQRLVERVEAGEADVVVVWKVSRFGRTRRDWYVHNDRLEVAGGRLESATEGFDSATSVGKFTRGMLVELAAFESDRIGDVWKEVQASRVKDGFTHNGRARFGYSYVDGLHVPDPDAGPVLVDLYRRFTAGESVYALVRDLNGRGVKTMTGGPWSDRTLRRVLDSGFAAGLFPYLGELHGGRHERLITDAEWSAYLDAKAARSRVAPRSQRSPYLLSGLVRCASCGGAMIGGTSGPGRRPKYRCETHRGSGGVRCVRGLVDAGHVHDSVRDWLRTIADDVDGAAARAAVDTGTARAGHAADAERLAREVTRLEGALVRLTQQHAEDSDSDDVVFRAARDDYRARLEQARAAHADAGRAARALEHPAQATARPLLDDWGTLGVSGRREVLRRLVACVLVRERHRGTPPFVAVVPLWEVR
jgi:site-specific DNA recombinase